MTPILHQKWWYHFSTSDLTIKADKYDVIFSNNSAKDGSDIFMNGNTSNTNPTLSLISNENKTITFASGISSTDNGYNINIDGKGTVKLDSYVKNANVTVNGNLLLSNNSNINNNNNHFTFNNGSSLSTINNKIDKFNDGLITINGDTNISIDISLPEMSIKPFIRYYIGVQKRIDERFTGFGQIFFNTLGRSGIRFSFGFKWSLGRTLPKKLPEPVYVHE